MSSGTLDFLGDEFPVSSSLRFVLSAFTFSELSFSSVAVVRDAIAAFSFATHSKLSHIRLVGATVICVPRRPDKWASELAVYMVGGPVVVS